MAIERYLLESGAPDGYQLEDGSGVLLLESSSAATADDSKPPFFQPTIARRRMELGFASGNLLLTTLAAVASPPIVNAVFDNPPKRPGMVRPLHWTRSLAAAAPVVEALPPGATLADQPSKRQAQRPWEQPPNVALRALAAGVTAPPGGASFDLPPRVLTIRRGDQQQNVLLLTLPPAQALPPGAEALDAPPRRAAHRQPEHARNAALLNLTAGTPPIVQTDWPRPSVARRASSGLQERNTQLLDAPAVTAPPVVQTDWPPPPRALQRPRPLHAKPRFDALEPPLEIPVRQQDWPLPRRAEWMRGQTTLLTSFQQDTQEFPPGRLQDWPLPPIRAPQPRGWVAPNLLLSTLYVPPTPLPFNNFDWPKPPPLKPQPRGAVEPNLQLSTLYVAPQPLPFNQFSWPLPQRARIGQINYHLPGTPVPNAIPPPPVPVPGTGAGLGGGGGGGVKDWWKEKPKGKRKPDVYDRLHKDIQEVRIDAKTIRDIYSELVETEAAETAAPALAKHSSGAKPAVETVNWDAAAKDAEAIMAVLEAARIEEQRRILEDDDDFMMLF